VKTGKRRENNQNTIVLLLAATRRRQQGDTLFYLRAVMVENTKGDALIAVAVQLCWSGPRTR
jgi:hypothetical protein